MLSTTASTVLGFIAQNGGNEGTTDTILWIIAAILVIVGIVQLFQGQILWGVVLIVLGCLVGPGGYSIFSRRA